MFYYVCGELALREAQAAVIDCGGVGYRLTVSLNTSEALSGSENKKVKLFTYLQVREDGVELYGVFVKGLEYLMRLHGNVAYPLSSFSVGAVHKVVAHTKLKRSYTFC